MSEHLEDQNGQEVTMQEEPSSAERCLTLKSNGLFLFLSTEYVTGIVNGHSITHLPLTPSFVKEVINLRGQTFPVVDIRVCVDKPEAEYTNETCIVALNVDSIPPGVMVDSIRQVMGINLDCVRPISSKRQRKLLDGMTTAGDGNMLTSFDCASPASYQYQRIKYTKEG